jgi:hypothetical protein
VTKSPGAILDTRRVAPQGVSPRDGANNTNLLRDIRADWSDMRARIKVKAKEWFMMLLKINATCYPLTWKEQLGVRAGR